VLGAALTGAWLAAAWPAAADELAAGERIFRSQCMGCHALEPERHRAGPSLHGLVGRQAGIVEGFDFSPAMTEAGIEWTAEALDAFLADPAAMVPGTRMVLWGLDPGARERVIRYLEVATEDAG
jgi:cytochrome c